MKYWGKAKKYLKKSPLRKVIKRNPFNLLRLNKKKPWQLHESKNVYGRFEIIEPILQEFEVNSVLDIGCNAGVVTRLAGEMGIFSVGIDTDINFRGVKDPLNKACIGKYVLDEKLADKLPAFDAVFLFSVHHHFIRTYGDEEAKKIISKLAGKTNKILIFEVAGLNRNYKKKPGELFIDNDEKSVTSYTQKWLEDALPSWKIKYLWKNERPTSAGSRYLFICHREEGIT